MVKVEESLGKLMARSLLFQLRKTAKLTQTAAAALVGCDTATVRKWEGGGSDKTGRKRKLIQLLKRYKTDADRTISPRNTIH